MGQRANLVVVEAGRRTLYYDHWCANRLDVELFWGPRLALEFVRLRAPVGEQGWWLDTLWCEGAAVIDLDRHVLLWFGGEDIAYDARLRRAHARLMSELWRGWTIRWAPEGLLSIADELRLPRAQFHNRGAEDAPALWWRNEEFPEDNSIAISLRRDDGELLVGRLCGAADGLYVGAALLDRVAAHSSLEALVWDGEFPHGGVHIDCLQRTLDVWWAPEVHELVERTRAAWPKWTVRWHFDRYEAHLELAAGKLVLPPAGDARSHVLDRLESMLVHEARNPAREALHRMGDVDAKLSRATDATRGSAGSVDEKRRLLESLVRSG